jgi:hypothetical protein
VSQWLPPVVPRLPPVTLWLPPVKLWLPPVKLRLAPVKLRLTPVPLMSLGSHGLRARGVVMSLCRLDQRHR